MAKRFNIGSNSLFEFVVLDGNGVKSMADSGVTKLSELYIQAPEERIDPKLNSYSVDDNLPIDLSGLYGPKHEQVVEQIAKAAEKFGFFQVINHGVSLELIESLKVAAQQFFDRPAEKKAAYHQGVSPNQLVVYGTSFAPETEKALEWKDRVIMFYTNDADALQYWPTECKEVVLEYLKTCNKVAKTIFNALMEKLGVTIDDARVDALLESKKVAMNLYPKCPNPELAIGTGRHTDSGTITLLSHDTISGLYVKIDEDMEDGKKEGEWMEIPIIPGALVINIGDTVEILSNGKYRSAEHRVGASSTNTRVTIPFFAVPRASEPVGPLPQAVESSGGIARYRELKYGEYTNYKFAKTRDGKKLSSWFCPNQLTPHKY